MHSVITRSALQHYPVAAADEQAADGEQHFAMDSPVDRCYFSKASSTGGSPFSLSDLSPESPGKIHCPLRLWEIISQLSPVTSYTAKL
ncbi:hypothetical protein AXG93_3823s1030 [Marchantia polymorpha subsp. ruderalis]|uniref:Uncharacterized protein n=1 Tax=Marchantia polymorpha subsp. ruderalis TaxID=1480154 RepID=A0A176WQ28_MARPO|nr:hypothetical protein AXG93_3823s1030 [Marchantia polymorpha subsp. ruderalis]